MDIKLYNIVAVVNSGFSDTVMEIAKDNGAKGGTIIPANGGVSDEASKLYGLDIHPEKEIVFILVKEALVKPILEKLYDKAGSMSEAQGIFFTLPVTHASDNLLNQQKKKTALPKQEKKEDPKEDKLEDKIMADPTNQENNAI